MKRIKTRRWRWAGGMLPILLFATVPAKADLFSFDGSNAQTFTAPVDGTYQITAFGASGGIAFIANIGGGLGAEIGGDFALTAGEAIDIYVGGVGGSGSGQTDGGGGGGTFVVGPGNTPLVIAGGGGGGGARGEGGNALATASSSDGGAGDPNIGNGGGGGGGFSSNGGGAHFFGGAGGGGYPNLTGGAGEPNADPAPGGGFGGGGGSGFEGAGGGGGYSGGNGAGNSAGGGGGGSYDADTSIDAILIGGENLGNGSATITLLPAAVPEPGSLVLFGTVLVGICTVMRRRKTFDAD